MDSNGAIEDPFNYLLEKRLRKHSDESVQSFYKLGILKNFAKFTRKHLCLSLFFSIKLQAISLQLYLTRDSSTGAFL